MLVIPYLLFGYLKQFHDVGINTDEELQQHIGNAFDVIRGHQAVISDTYKELWICRNGMLSLIMDFTVYIRLRTLLNNSGVTACHFIGEIVI